MKIGFIGLGIMGAPMARNLAEAGYSLVVFNRTRERAEEFVSSLPQADVTVAATPAEVAETSDLVIIIVKDTEAVREVVLGEEGVLAGGRPGQVVVDMSTIAPAAEQEMAVRLQEREMTLLDAPVSGGDVGAKEGTLAIMVGGPESALRSILPVLQRMGKTITYCGPVGCGQLTKLCNQILVSVTLLGVSEAVAMARRCNLDAERMIEAVRGGAAGSWQLSNLGPRILSKDFAPGFMVELMQKDLKLVLEAAGQHGAVLPATSLVHQFFNAAENRGWGREGTQVLARVIAQLCNLE